MGIEPARRWRRATVAAIAAAALLGASEGSARGLQGKSKKDGPESFHAKARITTGAAAADALVAIRIDRYTPDRDLETMERALQTGGHAAFVTALRAAPIGGAFEFSGQTFAIRWARQRPAGKGRVITVVTDSPVYFVGAGVPGAKPREGYDVAVIQLQMDSSGVGQGSMAPAARVKAGGPTGVDIEDYGSQPVKLVSVFRDIP